MSGQDWRRLAPGLIISALSLLVLLYFVNLGDFLRALQMADYRFVLGSIACSLLWMLVRAKAWRTLLQEKATYSQVFLTMCEGYLLNNILPFRLGEVGRCFLMGKKANLGFWQVLSSILIERALDMTLAVALLLSTLPFVVGANWARQAAILVGGVVVVGLGVLYLLARYREWALDAFNRLGGRWPVLIRLGGKMIPAFLDGLAVLTDAGRFLRAVFWMVLNWLLAIAQYVVLMRAFFPNVQLLWAAFGLGVLALGIAAPSSPGSVGVLEASLVGALSLFGLDPSVSLAFAITAHIIGYLLYGISGAYGLARDGESLGSLYQSARKLRER
jgi:uncharacterized protein (TIRG00374 family)